MLKRFIQSIANRRPHREITGDNGEPYLHRYYLFSIGPKNDPWIVGYLHRFIDSDPDRGYHDHPWPWAFSAVLSGWYFEYFIASHTPTGVAITVRDPLSWSIFGPDHRHRVVLAAGSECWTLFVHGPWRKPWGFWRPVQFKRHSPEFEYSQYSDKPTIGWWRNQ